MSFALTSADIATAGVFTPKVIEPLQIISAFPMQQNERQGEIGAHLPVKANDLARSGSANKASESGFCQINRPARVRGVACRKARLTERMDPLGQIMKVLTIAIPLQLLIYRFIDLAFPERLADP